MQDLLGKTIETGHIITYPGRRSSSCWLNVARVLVVGEKTLQVERIEKNPSGLLVPGKKVTLGLSGYMGDVLIVG